MYKYFMEFEVYCGLNMCFRSQVLMQNGLPAPGGISKYTNSHLYAISALGFLKRDAISIRLL